MCGLNVAYFRSFIMQVHITVNFHWYHDEHYQFHFEDPESIIEKFDYLHQFYMRDNTNVTVNHVFNSKDLELFNNRYRRHRGIIRNNDYRCWSFNTSMLSVPTVKGKIVLWRQTFNANIPSLMKRIYDNDGWNAVVSALKTQDYEVIEVDYRTPIREVLWHLSTCECAVGYEGMWHIVAKNLWKPMVVFTRDHITKLHTPNAYILAHSVKRKFSKHILDDFEPILKEAKSLINTNYKSLIVK